MGTVKELLEIAERQIGTVESPPSSNNVRYNTWYYGREVMGSAYPWCMVFCQWVFDKANVKVPIRTASCTAMYTAAKKHNCFVNKYHLQPGDLVLYSFGRTSNTCDHCGIIKSINGIKMEVIEGNTSTGNDSNGGAVMMRNRTIEKVVGAFRPQYEREEDLDMTKKEFIDSLTDEEAYTLLTKAMKHANKQPQPSWSKKEGHWDAAIKKKIIDTDSPEGIVKRDEMIAIFGRLGLIDK